MIARPLLLLFCLSLMSGPALGGGTDAPDPGPKWLQLVQAASSSGAVSSVAYRRLPEGFPIEVRTQDDTEVNLDILDRMVVALERTGHLVEKNAPLELSFNSQMIQGSSSRNLPSLGRIGASNEQSTGTRGSGTGVDVELNVWSSTQDSILGGRKTPAGQSRRPRFHISAELRDRGTGHVLWQADAVAEIIDADERRIARAMVRPLIQNLGQTVKNQPFAVP